jgi:DNA repair exonuclease SbcCD nuclease subunit
MIIYAKNVKMTQAAVTALIIGDPHFKVTNVRETELMASAIIKHAKERNPDIIVVLGDVLDRHETIHVSPLTRATKFLHQLMEVSRTFVLIGNHDLKNNQQFLSDEHPFDSLKKWGDRMTVVDTTTLVTINGQIFVFVPYVPPGRFKEALAVTPGWERASCIFAHQEFKGSQMGAIISEEGDVWELLDPFVISGHIHDYQEPQVNMIYTGTPIQHAFGDHHDKTISYVTFESTQERQHERIDLGLPRKHVIKITCAEVSTFVPQYNTELKIIIKGTSGELRAIRSHPNIEEWKKRGYKIIYKDTPLTDESQLAQITPARISQKYSQVLYNTISGNPRLTTLYTKIFGTVLNARPIVLNII